MHHAVKIDWLNVVQKLKSSLFDPVGSSTIEFLEIRMLLE